MSASVTDADVVGARASEPAGATPAWFGDARGAGVMDGLAGALLSPSVLNR